MRTPDVEPLMPGHVPDVDLSAHEPDVAGRFVSPREDDERSRILMWMTLDPDEHFDDLTDVLIHEIHHAVLHEVEDFETCQKLDNIVSRELRLIDGTTTIDDR